MTDLAVLWSLHNQGLGHIDTWSFVIENPPWPYIPEPALFFVRSGSGVHFGMTHPNTGGEVLGVHLRELLAGLQHGNLP